MRLTVGTLRKLIREAHRAQPLDELFGKKSDLTSMMKSILQDLYNANKKIEQAHEMAPVGPARAVVAGMHSDLFNKIAEFRQHIAQLSQLSKSGTGAAKPGGHH